jgi:hypothetical protein
MRSRLALTLLGLLALSLIGPAGAGAATEIGDSCEANEATGSPNPPTLFEISAAANPLPLIAPAAGVVTAWKVNLTQEAAGFTIPSELRILRLDTGAKTALVVGQASGNVIAGQNTFSSRLPIAAGDRVGLFGPDETFGTLICITEGENRIAGFPGGSTSSATPYFEASAPLRIPVAAVVEPDADNDGYGDETQDQCPQSASTQAACPVIVVDSYPLAKKSSIVVLVAVDETAPVGVAGTVKLPKGKKAKLRKVSKTVSAGRLTSFKLKFPGKLKSALKALAPGKKLTVKLTASATSVAGQTSTDKAKVKLKG